MTTFPFGQVPTAPLLPGSPFGLTPTSQARYPYGGVRAAQPHLIITSHFVGKYTNKVQSVPRTVPIEYEIKSEIEYIFSYSSKIDERICPASGCGGNQILAIPNYIKITSDDSKTGMGTKGTMGFCTPYECAIPMEYLRKQIAPLRAPESWFLVNNGLYVPKVIRIQKDNLRGTCAMTNQTRAKAMLDEAPGETNSWPNFPDAFMQDLKDDWWLQSGQRTWCTTLKRQPPSPIRKTIDWPSAGARSPWFFHYDKFYHNNSGYIVMSQPGQQCPDLSTSA